MLRELEGLLALDLTRLLPGAVATQYLADHGAMVIKIEQPGAGDYARTLSPNVFAKTNCGKKSIALDLKHPAGKEVLLALVRHADILIDGYRPGVMQRLGLAYENLRAVNPRLIHASISGYGQDGPYANLAGHDINYIALGGVLGLNLGEDGAPVIPGVQLGDLVGGSMQAVMGILLALAARHRTGEGRFVGVSMTAGAQSLLAIPLAGPGNEMLSGFYGCYSVYRAKDGRWLAVGALEGKFWAELCRRLACAELIPLQFQRDSQHYVKSRLALLFAQRDAQDWFAMLREFDCCVTPVLTVEEVAASLPAAQKMEIPPQIGEHTAELLRKYVCSEEEIETLKGKGAIA